MFPRDLGSNRLRSGFHAPTIRRSASHPGTPSDSQDEDSPSPIRMRDFETEDEETDGGITLNLLGHGDHTTPIVISDDEDESELEEGEERDEYNTVPDREMVDLTHEKQLQDPSSVSYVVDSTIGIPQTHLRDLKPAQLEEQIKYAFWQYPRDEIDLTRLVRCLHCQANGHLNEACPEKRCRHCNAYAEHDSRLCPSVKRCQRCREPGHSNCQGMKKNTTPCDICTLTGHTEDDCPIKHYPRQNTPATERLELWISCCGCASRSHLIGDCPDVSGSKAARWSLRSIDADKILNLTIQTSTENWEKEVENRNMRPEGLKIRGRANLHNADMNRRDRSDSDDLENFFSRPPPQNSRRAPLPRGQHVDTYRPDLQPRYDGYDRYDGYQDRSDVYRPPRNAYYATDSFGRPRSRSPPRFDQRGYGRPGPPRSPSYDSYRLSDEEVSDRHSPPVLRDNPFNRINQDAPQTVPSRGFSMQLPTRKGSNPNLQSGASASRAPAPGQQGSTKNSNKQNNNVGQTAYQKQHNGLTKSQRKAKKKKKAQSTS